MRTACVGTDQHGRLCGGTHRFAISPLSPDACYRRQSLATASTIRIPDFKVRRMNNSNSTDPAKTNDQPTPFVKKGESNNDAQPAKVEEPTPSPDTGKEPAADDAAAKSV